jgi:putative ABC transport system permease protein
MRFTDLVDSSFHSLKRTKTRSSLTILGIVIGVMSVILMLTLGQAAQRYILSQVSSFGSDTLFIVNGPSVDSGQPSLFIKQSLTMSDVKKLQSQPWVTIAAGQLSQGDTLIANGLDTNVTVSGTMPDQLDFGQNKIQSGNFFSSSAVDGRAREIVLGHDIADSAFGSEKPVGKSVKINGQSFRVVGVMEKAGSKGFTNVDTIVYIPITSALDLYHKTYLSQISLKTTIPVIEAKERLSILIRERHNIDNPTADASKDDFHVQTQDDLIKSASTIATILQILLTSIAAISLLVGGVGIMNIMYVTVTERTKEIGLRKSIGASEKDILKQFVFEAIVQTTVGGIIGALLGISISWLGIQLLSSLDAGWNFEFSINNVVLGVSVSAAIGIIFGYFPAKKAARLNPIEALNKD